jgi:YVTN family beta-propeller protein
VGASATGVAYDPLGSAVFVADSVHHVMPYQALPPFAVLGPPITTGAFPVWVAVNPKINRIYVANFASENVMVYDRAAPGFPIASLPQPPCAPGPSFPTGSLPSGMDVNPTTNQIYVALYGLNQLWVMDGAPPWGCAAPVPVGASPVGVAYNPVNNHIYVANKGSNSVTIIDAATLNVVNPGLPVGVNPWGVAVSPTMKRVYVTNYGGNSVSVIDASTDTVVETVPVGSSPTGVAVNPVTNLVFVANSQDDTVSVIEDLPSVSPPPTPTPPAPPPPTPTLPAPPPPGPPPPGGTEQLSLQGGACTPVASTYPDATPIANIAGGVAPPGVLESLWEFDGVTWLGYSPQFPAASNLTQMDRLDVVFICVGGSGPGAGTFTRPVI